MNALYHTHWNLLPAFNNNTITYLSRQLNLCLYQCHKRLGLIFITLPKPHLKHPQLLMPTAWGTICVEFLTQLKCELKLHKKLSLVSFEAQFSSYRNSFSKWWSNLCRCNFFCQTSGKYTPRYWALHCCWLLVLLKYKAELLKQKIMQEATIFVPY